MPLYPCDSISQMTNREFRTWMRWLDERWNRPDRIDHYLMRIAYEVRHVLDTKPSTFRSKDYTLSFKNPTAEPTAEERAAEQRKIEYAAYMSKCIWAARLGYRLEEAEAKFGNG